MKFLVRSALVFALASMVLASASPTACPIGDRDAGNETIMAGNLMAKYYPTLTLAYQFDGRDFEPQGPVPEPIRYADGFWVNVADWFELTTYTETDGDYDIDVHFWGSELVCDDYGCEEVDGFIVSCAADGGDETCDVPDNSRYKASDALIVASAGTDLDVRVCLG